MRHLLERIQSDQFANEIMKAFRQNVDSLMYEGTDILMDVIWDAHMEDLTGHEQTLFKMMMSCFDMEYLSETWVNDISDYYLRYTYRGNQISNRKENFLCEHVEQEWVDFVHEFSDEEMLERYATENGEVDFDDWEFRAMHIVLDVNNPHYYTVVYLLEALGFIQVDEELLMYGCYGSIGYESCEPSFEWIKNDLIDALKDIPTRRKLNRIDLACLDNLDMNSNVNSLFVCLANMGQISAREVLF